MKRRNFIISIAVAAVLVFVAGYATALIKAPLTSAVGDAALAHRFPLLSRSVLADNSDDILINFVGLRTTLEGDFSDLPAGTPQSFYFEYLPDGTSIGIGEDNNLVAASLIKTALAMNLYHASELGKLNLDDTVTVTDSELDSAYGNLYLRGAGYKLTLRQAAEHALEESDNTAMHVMFDHVGSLLTYNDQSLAGLDIDQNLDNGQATINARSFASVMKSLYFSSYLSKEHSQELLSYLTKSTEHSRIIKNLPSNIVVAHKNGVNNANHLSQSDCGVVYVPQRPYVICAMIGLPPKEASDFMAKISKEVYVYVTSQN